MEVINKCLLNKCNLFELRLFIELHSSTQEKAVISKINITGIEGTICTLWKLMDISQYLNLNHNAGKYLHLWLKSPLGKLSIHGGYKTQYCLIKLS